MDQFKFHIFWRKYGNFVLGGLLFLFIISYCNQQKPVPGRQTSSQQENVTDNGNKGSGERLKSFEELMRARQEEHQPEGPGSFFTMLMLLALGFGIVWLARQKWWLDVWTKWFPGRVKFKVTKGKDRVTRRDLLRIWIFNNTAEGLTFMPPMVVFRKGGKERRFRFRSSNQDEMFPLTLTPGTGHRVVLDLEQFFEKIPDLKGAGSIGATVETTDGKKYKDFALPAWLEMLFK